MEILEFDYKNVPQKDGEFVLCLGYFDAVHLGHQKVINAALASGYKVAVMTFDEPPLYVLKKRKEQLALTSNADKAEIFSNLGVERLYILHFDEELANLSRYEFIDLILRKIDPKIIYCGEDYTFGNNAEGNTTYLSNYFNVQVISFAKDNDTKVSSRVIKTLIKDGDVKSAARLIGRPYRICGLVHHGLGNGKKLGFPTANIVPDYPYVIPKEGVYMGYGIYNEERFKAIVSIGTHPTIIKLEKPTIEIHFIDFDQNLYGQFIFIEFVEYMRENFKFRTVDDLIAQLKKDRTKAKKMLK